MSTTVRTEATLNPARVHRAVRLVLGVLFLLGGLALVWPAQHGGHLGLTVVSGASMQPGLRTGDIVLTWRHAAYSPGDVVVYPVPNGPGQGVDVVHRVIAVHSDATLVTQGDNNHGPDPWHPTQAAVVGSRFGQLHWVGIGITLIHRPAVITFALASFAAMCVWLLVLDWDDDRDDPADPSHQAA